MSLGMRDFTTTIRRLIAHHDQIEEVLGRAERSLRAAEIDALNLGRGRWELARALSAYQHFKHAELFDPMIAHGTPLQAQSARKMKAACIAFGTQFRAHLMLWGSADILDDWARYKPDAIDMQRRIRAHLMMERRQADALVVAGRSVA